MPVLSNKSASNIDLRRVLDIEVPLIVKLAERKLDVKEVLRLNIGTIIEFEKDSEASLQLLVNNRQIGEGEAVKVSENFGLRVTKIASKQDRAEALTGQ
ncbi:MAG: FliM/FliN family flagellar motor switch protein [Planctomycetota bacterium]